jgi:hypothetical protein
MEEKETLREALDRIMPIPYPAAYATAFEELRVKHGHTIERRSGERQWLDTFNCYALALDLVDTPRYRRLVDEHGDSALADSAFVTGLIEDAEVREIPEDEIRPGSLVAYFNTGALTHCGLILSDSKRVRSKWGPSELYEHELWEVGASYGREVRFFEPPDPDHILDLLEACVSREPNEVGER